MTPAPHPTATPTMTPVPRCRRAATTGRAMRVVLLHGLAGSASTWDACAPLVDDRCELWDVDLPWRSEGDPSWAHDPDVGRWIAAAIAEVEAAAGPVDVVVAHSFAATLLLGLLADGVLSPPPATVLVSPFFRAGPDDFDWDAIAYYLVDFDRILAEGIRVRAGARLRPELGREMALRVRARVGPYGWVRFFDSYLRTPLLDLARVDRPVLVVGGDRDIAASAMDARTLAAALPDARLEVLDGCGHFPMLEQPERFAGLVDRAAALAAPLAWPAPATPLPGTSVPTSSVPSPPAPALPVPAPLVPDRDLGVPAR